MLAPNSSVLFRLIVKIISSLAVFLLLFSIEVSAQKIKKMRIKWAKTTPTETVEQYKSESAYIVEKQLTMIHRYMLSGGFEAESFKSENKRVKVLDASGVKKYSDIIVNVDAKFSFESVDARTIKKSGKSIPVEDTDILIKRFVDPISQDVYQQVRFSLKNVEPGDEVEYLVTSKSKQLSGANFLFVHEDIPCLKNSIVVRVKQGLETVLYSKNGLAKPVKNSRDDYDIFSWELKNLEGYSNTHSSDKYSVLPHCFYYLKRIYIPSAMTIPYNIGLQDWGDLRARYEEVFNDNAKRRGFKEIMDFVASDELTTSSLPEDKLRALVSFVNQEFEILDELPQNETNLPFAKYVENKRIDRDNLTMFYEAVIAKLGLDCEFLFARNKFSGPIIMEIVSAGQITAVGLAFKDSENKQRVLFIGSKDILFELDEVPPVLQGTRAIILAKIEDSRKLQTGLITLKSSKANENVRDVSIVEKVNLEGDSADFECVVSLSGVYNLLNRVRIERLIESQKISELSEFLLEDFSRELSVSSVEKMENENANTNVLRIKIRGKMKSKCQKIDENVYALSIKNSINHHQITTQDEVRKLDYINYFPYLDRLNYKIEIDREAEFESLEKNQFMMNIGSVNSELQSMQLVNSGLAIQSSYMVSGNSLTGEEYEKLKNLHIDFANVIGNDIIFTLK